MSITINVSPEELRDLRRFYSKKFIMEVTVHDPVIDHTARKAYMHDMLNFHMYYYITRENANIINVCGCRTNIKDYEFSAEFIDYLPIDWAICGV